MELNERSKDIQYPDLYLQYGKEERPETKLEAEKIAAKYEEANSFCELKKYEGGHDFKKNGMKNL